MARRRVRSPKEREKRAKARLVLGFGAGALGLVLIGTTIWLLHIEEGRISEIEVKGVDTVGSDAVEDVVRSQLAGAYGYLVPRDQFLVYPKRGIESALTEAFPRIKVATVEREGFSKLSVLVREYEPYALWCRSPARAACYFISNEGYIYSKAPHFSGPVYRTYYGGLASEDAPLQRTLLPREEFANLEAFIRGVEADERFEKVDFVHLNSSGDTELVLRNGLQIFLNRSLPAAALLSNLESTMQAEAITSAEALAHIDLRFGNRIYIKRK